MYSYIYRYPKPKYTILHIYVCSLTIMESQHTLWEHDPGVAKEERPAAYGSRSPSRSRASGGGPMLQGTTCVPAKGPSLRLLGALDCADELHQE